MEMKNSGAKKDKKTGGTRAGCGLLSGAQNSGGGFLPWAASAFDYRLFDEAACRAWVLERLHPEGARCPACGLALDGVGRENFWAGLKCYCGRCGRRFTARSGTFLQNAQMEYRQIYALIFCLKAGLAAPRIAEVLRVTPNTIRYWTVRLDFFNKNKVRRT